MTPDYARLTREQLIVELERQRRDQEDDARLRAALQEADVRAEEIRIQNAELLETRRSLEVERDRWAELYELAPVAYLVTDLFGVIQSVNLAAVRLLGGHRATLIGLPLLGLVATGHRRQFLDHLRRCRLGGAVESPLEVTSRDGRLLCVQLVSKRMQTPGDTALSAMVDLTARHQAESARRQAEIECEQLARQREVARAESEAKDRFIAVLSHELRNPLSPIMLTVEALQRGLVEPDKLGSALDVIRRNVEIEVRLIDDLLDVSRITHAKLHLELKLVDLHAVVTDVANGAGVDAEPGRVTLRVDLGATQHAVNGDATRLRQIVWNLVGNAIRNTPPGGQVLLSTRDAGDQIQLTVRDTGRGIPAPLLERIFEPFDQAERPGEPARGGLGLGLAIARGLVEAHGGHIAAASPGTGRGATFTVELPVVVGAALKRPMLAPLTARSKPLRILVVEDERDAAEALAEILRSRGHDVLVAGSLAAAVAHASDPLDVVVSDIALPDGSGLELLTRLGKDRTMRGIALSGFGTPADVRRSIEAGFERHLTKPVDIDALLAVVEGSNGERTSIRPATPVGSGRNGAPSRGGRR
jgi:PAS domain S-box-containing protein